MATCSWHSLLRRARQNQECSGKNSKSLGPVLELSSRAGKLGPVGEVSAEGGKSGL